MSPERPTALLKAALGYAQVREWLVLPCWWITGDGACACGKPDCTSPGKHPLEKFSPRGLKDATLNSAQISDGWTRFPLANIAIATGQTSGFDVLDVDPRHGGEESLAELESQHGKLPETAEQLTGGGGRHLLFRHQEGVSNRTSFLPGLDVRGEGGYIMAAPSNHRSGRNYTWELSSHPLKVALSDWPDWLLERVRKPSRAENARPAGSPVERPTTTYGRAALEAEAEIVRDTPPGGQELALNVAGLKIGGLVGAGEIDYQEVLAALVDAGMQMTNEPGKHPWTREQVQKKVEHGLADGMKQPRTVPELPRTNRGNPPEQVEPPPIFSTHGTNGHGNGHTLHSPDEFPINEDSDPLTGGAPPLAPAIPPIFGYAAYAIAEITRAAYRAAEELAASGREFLGLDCGFDAINSHLNGLCPGELTVLAGRQGQGKTTMALQMMLSVAQADKTPVGILSIEMTVEQLGGVFCRMLARVDPRRQHRGRLTEEEQSRYYQAINDFARLPVWIFPDVRTVEVVEERIQQHPEIGLWVVDHLHRMQGPGDSKHDELGTITKGLDGLTKKYNKHLLLLAQLNRASEARVDKIPESSDLRGSGSIEEDAVNILMIHRPGGYRVLRKKAANDPYALDLLMREATILVEKSRFEGPGVLDLAWIPAQVMFGNLAPKAQEYPPQEVVPHWQEE